MPPMGDLGVTFNSHRGSTEPVVELMKQYTGSTTRPKIGWKEECQKKERGWGGREEKTGRSGGRGEENKEREQAVADREGKIV